ncbi:hypothetical protein PG993_013696 [Apiospora rasikravindrae]|uniref:Uncharacterized protein n=1 Tax=Apiospora rasikravindrae TaxID=990691 RepID=A0ABR1RQY4_9PEZI
MSEVSPFLGLPLEIRDMIYDYSFTVDQPFNLDPKTVKDYRNVQQQISKFNLNRQIRHEVWDHLIRTNLWVRINIGRGSPFISFLEKCTKSYPFLLFPSRAPLEYKKLLCDKVAICFSLDKLPGSPPHGHGQFDHTQSVTFAYHPLTYGYFLHELSSISYQHLAVTIQINPFTLLDAPKSSRLVKPLNTVRGLSSVNFTGVEGYPELQRLMDVMQRSPVGDRAYDEAMEVKQHFRDEGRAAELRGHYSDAMCQYWLGLEHDTKAEDLFLPGTPYFDSLSDMETALGLDFSRAAHKNLTPLMRDSTSCCNIRGSRHAGWVAFKARTVVWETLQNFVGFTDRQRREAHLYRAFHALHCADYFQGLLADAEGKGVEYALKDRTELENDVDPGHDILADLDEDDRDACARIRQRPGPQAFEVATHEVPLLGDWTGDPRLWDIWTFDERTLMKLHRQRHDVGPDGGPGTPEDLALAYEKEGIAWEYEDDGEIVVTILVPGA